MGGGLVAERKTLSLLEARARVTIIAPSLTKKLLYLNKARKISWRPQRINKRDINRFALVVAATDDSLINKKISLWAKQKNILVNVVDRPDLSTTISPAVLRIEKAIIAVYTDAKEPVLSRDLKNFIKEHWGEFLSYRTKL